MNGDQVEIITAESQKPQREWLEYVHTPKAKEIIYDSLKADIEDAITRIALIHKDVSIKLINNGKTKNSACKWQRT